MWPPKQQYETPSHVYQSYFDQYSNMMVLQIIDVFNLISFFEIMNSNK
jgi:hypothetical protein